MSARRSNDAKPPLGWGWVGLSLALWIATLAASLAPMGLASRTIVSTIAFVAAEISFWFGLIVLGSRIATHMEWLSLPFACKAMVDLVSTVRHRDFSGKIVAVFGATGGIGNALTEALVRQSATVIALGRDREELRRLGGLYGIATFSFDLSAPQALEIAVKALPQLDAAIFASGVDVRKPLTRHTDEEIASELRVNLHGPILITRALIERMKPRSVIAHIGGFGDGGLALPYYTVDVAARAGLAGFCESATRELRLEGSDIVVSYLSPEPTATNAERPYLELWRRIGSRVVTPEATAAFVLDSVRARRTRATMGPTTALLAAINAISPYVANVLALRGVGLQLRGEFGSPPSNARAEG